MLTSKTKRNQARMSKEMLEMTHLVRVRCAVGLGSLVALYFVL